MCGQTWLLFFSYEPFVAIVIVYRYATDAPSYVIQKSASQFFVVWLTQSTTVCQSYGHTASICS